MAAGADVVAGSKLPESMIPGADLAGTAPIVFPDPGKLAGIKSRVAPVVKMSGIRFSYGMCAVFFSASESSWPENPCMTSVGDDDESPLINGADVQLTLGSRCAMLGKNGAGKTTMMKLVVGELEPTEGESQVMSRDARLARALKC